jgi:hypothetical protein
MIFNCLQCGTSISTKHEHCIYCKANNTEIIQVLTGKNKLTLGREKLDLREKLKGTILSYVLR